METIKIHNIEGKETGEMKLPAEIFDLKFNADLTHQALVAHLANNRQILAHTKDRSEVRGGGKKPWRQKGTGRARHGSRRSPIWIGGGVTFGPTKERNFSKKINQKMKKTAILMVLSAKAQENQLIVLDNLNLTQPKTKEMEKIIQVILPAPGSVLMVLAEKNVNIEKSAHNLKKVKIITVNNLNIYDLLNYKYIIMAKETVEKIHPVK